MSFVINCVLYISVIRRFLLLLTTIGVNGGVLGVGDAEEVDNYPLQSSSQPQAK